MHELFGKVTQASLDLRSPDKQSDRVFNPYVDRIIKQRIHLPESLEEDEETKISESLHDQFWKNQTKRKDKLTKIYLELSQPEDLIVMICCKKFLGFLELWLKSCEQNNISVHDKTLVFTFDSIADQRVNELGLKSYLFDPNIYQLGGGTSRFGDHAFQRTMFYKNAAILESLRLGANVLFQDADLIWLNDPLLYLKEQDRSSHIQIMYDGPNRLHYPYYANTGFFYVKNQPVCDAVFETALRNTSAIFKLGGHQPPFNRICHHFAAHNLLKLNILPESQFLNGHLFNIAHGVQSAAETWQTDGIVIHYSWTGSCDEKIEKLEKFNYFNIDYPSRASISSSQKF